MGIQVAVALAAAMSIGGAGGRSARGGAAGRSRSTPTGAVPVWRRRTRSARSSRPTPSFGDRGVWLEMDTQLSADGQLVVLHDDTLDRTTNCAWRGRRPSPCPCLAACDAGVSFPGWGAVRAGARPARRPPRGPRRRLAGHGRDQERARQSPTSTCSARKVADALVVLVRGDQLPARPPPRAVVLAAVARPGRVRAPGRRHCVPHVVEPPGLPGIGIPVLVNALLRLAAPLRGDRPGQRLARHERHHRHRRPAPRPPGRAVHAQHHRRRSSGC